MNRLTAPTPGPGLFEAARAVDCAARLSSASAGARGAVVPAALLRCLLLLACLLNAAAAVAQARLPVAPVRNVPEVFFGVRVDDPYRELENTKAPAVAAWMKAHSDHAHQLLRSISGRDALREKLDRYDSASAPRVAEVTRLPGDGWVYQRRASGDEPFKLVVRQGLQGRETVVFDPGVLQRKTGQPQAIQHATPSPDGRWVAVAVSAGGGPEAVLRVLELRTGRSVGREVDRALPGGVSWLPDSSGFFFTRAQPGVKALDATDKPVRSAVAFMKPGGNEASIRTVLRTGQDLEMGPAETAQLEVQPDGRALLVVGHGESNALKLWHSTAAAVLAGKADWKPLADRADKVTAVALKGDQFYALTHAAAPRFQVVGGSLEQHTVATAPVLVPDGERLLTGLAVAGDALYVAAREGNLMQLLRRAHRVEAPVVEVPLPALGSFSLGAGNARADLPGVLLRLGSWTRASQLFLVGADGRAVNTGLQQSGPYDAPGDLLATEVQVRSADGAMVPLSIIHKADVPLDGNNPTLLYGHASHGLTEGPQFSVSRLAWLEAGGVLAVANPRGSGAWGPLWHEAGKQASKPNSWRDFIACAEYLVAQRWTRPARLAIGGGGAGGILLGMAMNERPDLFAAVVPEVGALDLVRFETTAHGGAHTAEFGSRASEEGFAALLAMSPYHHIQDGVQYPAVLLTHGVNDPRVEVWNSTKTAARLMAASASGRPVLMRLGYHAGHGVGDTRSQVLDERADLFAFVLWQMGVPGYAPLATRR